MKTAGWGTVTSFDERQVRRASIYERREAQLHRRKVLTLTFVVLLLLLIVSIRLITLFGKKTDRPLPAEEHMPAQENAYLPEEVPVEVAVVPDADTDTTAPAEETTVYYTPAVETARSADAAFFFEGYQVVQTPDTVLLPGHISPQTQTPVDASLLQGASDTSDDDDIPADEDLFLDSEAAVLIDLDCGEIVCARNPDVLIYPASMTKILTLLVANEQITDRNALFTITPDIPELTCRESLSSVFWQVGETVTLTDLEYGTILPSGADAAIGLARLAAGDEESFSMLMNQKTAQLRLTPDAHFSNCIGMHDGTTRCTVTDMAMILKAAVEDQHVLDVLSMREYTTSKTAEHPDGVYMFNLFLDRTDLRTDLNGTVICAKTGYTVEALNCAATYFVSDTGKHYICVTALGHGSRRVVQDHVNLYNAYAK